MLSIQMQVSVVIAMFTLAMYYYAVPTACMNNIMPATGKKNEH